MSNSIKSFKMHHTKHNYWYCEIVSTGMLTSASFPVKPTRKQISKLKKYVKNRSY